MNNIWQDLPRPFFVLAPMDGVTDTVFRRVVSTSAAADIYMSEFTNTDSYCSPAGRHSTAGRLLFTPAEQPKLIAQIWGTKPEHFAEMAKGLAAMGYAGIDINMGCPAKDVTKTGACSALIDTPVLAGEIIAATKQAGLPVSVKTRVGFKTQNTEAWLGFLLRQDIAALTVHARTAKEMSKVPARWEEITKAVSLRNELAPRTLIIGNGDVRNRQDGLDKAAQTGADGIMIGRSIFSNVFCFERTPRTHTPTEYVALLRLHLDMYDQTWAGQTRPFAPLKRFFKIYIKDFPGASDLREALMHTNSTQEVRELLATRGM